MTLELASSHPLLQDRRAYSIQTYIKVHQKYAIAAKLIFGHDVKGHRERETERERDRERDRERETERDGERESGKI